MRWKTRKLLWRMIVFAAAIAPLVLSTILWWRSTDRGEQYSITQTSATSDCFRVRQIGLSCAQGEGLLFATGRALLRHEYEKLLRERPLEGVERREWSSKRTYFPVNEMYRMNDGENWWQRRGFSYSYSANEVVNNQPYRQLAIAFPLWVGALPAAVLIGLGLLRGIRCRTKPGCCVSCGYDLRGAPASSERCPECGCERQSRWRESRSR